MKTRNTTTTSQGKKLNVHDAFTVYCTPIDNGTRYPSYEDVAKHFGVHPRIIEKWGSKYEWVKEREASGEKRIVEAQEKAVTVLAERLANDREKLIEEMIAKDFEDAQKLEEGINSAVNIITGIQKELEKEGLTKQERSNLLKELRMQSLDLKNLSDALKTAKNFKRVILGLPTEISRADITSKNLHAILTPEDLKRANEFIARNAKS